MNLQHVFTLDSDKGQSASVYYLGDPTNVIIWAKIGASTFEIGSLEKLDEFIDLLQEIKTQTIGNNMESDNLFIEDAFLADQEGWITLPGNNGRVSPTGVVYDKDGVEMYSLHDEDIPTRMTAIDYTSEDYEWI